MLTIKDAKNRVVLFRNGQFECEDGQPADVSDGYHTMAELYEHRIALFIALCKAHLDIGIYNPESVWRSMHHSDGTHYPGWFILGLNVTAGKQITYHLPMDKWEETGFAVTLDLAPEYDGHTSADVLERLRLL